MEAIAGGSLRAGDPLESVRRLSVSFGINPTTVVKACDTLREDGLVRTTGRSGTVIARDPSYAASVSDLSGWRTRLHILLAEAHAQGLPVTEILSQCSRTAKVFEPAGT